jgi:hypothetical protein
VIRILAASIHLPPARTFSRATVTSPRFTSAAIVRMLKPCAGDHSERVTLLGTERHGPVPFVARRTPRRLHRSYAMGPSKYGTRLDFSTGYRPNGSREILIFFPRAICAGGVGSG